MIKFSETDISCFRPNEELRVYKKTVSFKNYLNNKG